MTVEGPPNTVLVSAAHCNYICKDGKGQIIDSCCCADEVDGGIQDIILNCRYVSKVII